MLKLLGMKLFNHFTLNNFVYLNLWFYLRSYKGTSVMMTVPFKTLAVMACMFLL